MSLPLPLILIILSTFFNPVISQPFLNSVEQESVYQILESLNPDISWRSLFPDDLCYSAPHGVVCDYFNTPNTSAVAGQETVHLTELSFGYISDYSPNPPCNHKSTINTSALSSLPQLRKLLFYKCFAGEQVPVPEFSSFGSSLEELVFIENPSLVGSLKGNISRLSSLRRFVLTGSNVSGEIPDGLSDLSNLEQLTLSRNKFNGQVLELSLSNLKKLKVLDLSQNVFSGYLPESFGELKNLLKLDLSFNGFSGEFPESLKDLKRLEFLDLSYNNFSDSGVPLFLGEMASLKEVYLSGNKLGGQIPEIWKNLGGIMGLGLSKTGLNGKIPGSMGLFLKNLCYLGLDNNKLEGTVPGEFGTLELVSEINLENNSLSGRIPFSAKFVSKIGKKLKLKGNPELCVEEELRRVIKINDNWGQMKVCKKPVIPTYVLFNGSGSSLLHVSYVVMVISWILCFFLV